LILLLGLWVWIISVPCWECIFNPHLRWPALLGPKLKFKSDLQSLSRAFPLPTLLWHIPFDTHRGHLTGHRWRFNLHLSPARGSAVIAASLAQKSHRKAARRLSEPLCQWDPQENGGHTRVKRRGGVKQDSGTPGSN